jgi:hypothetical protein
MFNGHLRVLNFIQQHPSVTGRMALDLPDRIHLIALGRLNAEFSIKCQDGRGKVVVGANDFHTVLNANFSNPADPVVYQLRGIN